MQLFDVRGTLRAGVEAEAMRSFNARLRRLRKIPDARLAKKERIPRLAALARQLGRIDAMVNRLLEIQ